MTGASFLSVALEAKRLQLLRELLPAATLVGVLFNPRFSDAETQLKDVQAAARVIGQQIVVLHASTERDIDTAFANFAQQRVNALLVAADAFFLSAVTAVDVFGGADIERAIAIFASQPDGGLIVVPNVYNTANRGSIFLLAARHRLPTVYPFRFFAAEGGLMSYGPDQIEQWRGAATYVDRILRGEKPGQLPVQAPTKYELVVNLKTAKALGLSIPPAFPLRADEVIE